MNLLRKWVRDVFGFSGSEINGFLILIPLMLALVFSEPLYHAWMDNRPADFDEDTKQLDSLITHWESQGAKHPGPAVNQEVTLFNFNPNTVAVSELQRLGFTENLAKRIAAYRLKGGVFRIKSDLMKIYGLDSTLYEQLYTYISLPAGQLHQVRSYSSPPSRPSIKKGLSSAFDINTADTLLLKSVYGIGPTLATRIVKFRDRLGGFVKAEQLNEVYGLDSTVIQRLLAVGFIKPGFIPQQININRADETALSAHPYLRGKIARALLTYRFQHGDFMEVSDIKKLSILTPDEVDRVLPYLKIVD